jgi:hypothetical protein
VDDADLGIIVRAVVEAYRTQMEASTSVKVGLRGAPAIVHGNDFKRRDSCAAIAGVGTLGLILLAVLGWQAWCLADQRQGYHRRDGPARSPHYREHKSR